jgi:hypothetical protein
MSSIFAGHFGDGYVNKQDIYYIKSVDIDEEVWAADKSNALVTISHPEAYLPVQFVDSKCDTKRSFVSIIPVGVDDKGLMHPNPHYLLTFDVNNKMMLIKEAPRPISRADMKIEQESGDCVVNESYGSTPDGTRVWVMNGCSGEFSRDDGDRVSCTSTNNGYQECSFENDSQYNDLVMGSCFELVAGLDTSKDRAISFKVGWMSDPPTYLIRQNDTHVVAAAYQDSDDFRRKASWIVDKWVPPDPIEVPNESKDPRGEVDQVVVVKETQTQTKSEDNTILYILGSVIGIALAAGGAYLVYRQSRNAPVKT